jgi:ribonuclease G
MRKDKARSTVLRISELGLVQMTRKRTRESLEQLLTSPCPHCTGAGRVRSVETLAYDVLRRVQREAAASTNSTRIAVRVHPEVATFLDEHQRRNLEALERLVGRTVAIEAAPELERERVEVSLSGER